MQWRVARGSIHLHRNRLMPCQEIFCMKLEQPGRFGFLFGHTQGRKTMWIDPLVLARVTISYRGTFLFKELPYWVSLTISFLNVLYFFFQSFNINFRIYSWTKINRHKYWSRGIGFCAKKRCLLSTTTSRQTTALWPALSSFFFTFFHNWLFGNWVFYNSSSFSYAFNAEVSWTWNWGRD